MKIILLVLFLLVPHILADTPTKALTDYKKSVEVKDFESAWKYMPRFDGSPKEMNEYLKRRVHRSIKLASRGWDFEVLEEKIIGDCAVVVVNSVVDASNDDEWEKGVKAKFDPGIIYLIQQGGDWKVFPPAHGWNYVAKYVSKDKVETFKNLEMWFKARKIELKKGKGEQGVPLNR